MSAMTALPQWPGGVRIEQERERERGGRGLVKLFMDARPSPKVASGLWMPAAVSGRPDPLRPPAKAVRQQPPTPGAALPEPSPGLGPRLLRRCTERPADPTPAGRDTGGPRHAAAPGPEVPGGGIQSQSTDRGPVPPPDRYPELTACVPPLPSKGREKSPGMPAWQTRSDSTASG